MEDKNTKYIDLVLCGPDMSGTSTQVDDVITYYSSRMKKVKDMRGTEFEALFHSKDLRDVNEGFRSFDEFCNQAAGDVASSKMLPLLRSLRVASMVENEITSYVNPDNADVWIFEEPTRRSAGQVSRVIDQHRSVFGSEMNPYSAAITHSVYRVDEFLRFRKPLREKNKIIIRSRSEESACYQIKDGILLPHGMDMDAYLDLPGHKIAFGNPPTHLFVVCAPIDWIEEDYLILKKQRLGDRILDDYEHNASYQVLVNKRYASDWIDTLYAIGCAKYGSQPPQIIRFNMLDSKEKIREQMIKELNTL